MANPLIGDRDVEFILHEVLRAETLCKLEAFTEHSRETFDMVLASYRRLAREVLYPAYKAMDEEPPEFVDGRVRVHPRMKQLYPQLVELGAANATRPFDVDGQQLPLTIAVLANAYLMAANLSAYAYLGLTSGAAHLIEAFGDDDLKKLFMEPMYAGKMTGTMALTEPQAGSSLGDVKTSATPNDDGTYVIKGSKIFISGGDHDLTANIVHMVLARIDGAPEGSKGISLFVVPKLRPDGDDWVANDVATAGMIHKIGWRGLPSLVMNYGEAGECRGWLVGEQHRGLSHMFQMMNEARIMVGINGVATASVAYHEAVEYARTRPQGRALGTRSGPQIPIVEHADVRRMLLRQKAIVEGSLSLLATTSWYADIAEHSSDVGERERARLLVDLLTPIAKSFPAEKGFEANTLCVQVHGGYGYSSEYLPEAWLRDQKLNSIHEGTTGIQSLDLLGRKAVAKGGAALQALTEAVGTAVTRAQKAGVDGAWTAALRAAVATVGKTTAQLGALGASGDASAMLRHSVDYMELFSTVVIAWQWLVQAAAAKEGLGSGSTAFYEGKLCTAQYWFATELPRVAALARLCTDNDNSYERMQPDWY